MSESETSKQTAYGTWEDAVELLKEYRGAKPREYCGTVNN